MGIWFRVILLNLLAFGLTGCNLESKKSLFAEADAKLLLTDYPNLAAYERDEGGWKKNADPLNFTPEASHYLVNSGTSEMLISFVPIADPWWVLQAAEPAGPTSYVLIKAEPKELLVYSLECKRLKESGKFENEIEFKESDCSVKEGTDKTALFKALIGNASELSSKLVSEP
jgi:hypothetical protein